MNIKHILHGDVTTLEIHGQIRLGEGAVALRNKIRNLLHDGHRNIILDLGDTGYIYSSGIGELVSAFTTTSNQGGRLVLAELTTENRERLAITKLLTIFERFNSVLEAEASFRI